jgi:energy coupling factor transporter S component ThiW
VKTTQTITRMAILVALGVAASYLMPIPFYGAKLFPAQAAINVIAGTLLGPWVAGAAALIIALVRIALGTGSPMAIPGSIFGAMLAGLLYRATRHYIGAVVGEIIGTSLIGALAAYPVALLFLPAKLPAGAAATFFIIPFALPSVMGAVLGGIALPAIAKVAPPPEPSK